MSRDPLEAQMSERRRKVPRVLDESLVRSNPPVPGESADRVLAIGMQNHVPTAVRDRRKSTHDRGQLCDVARRFADVLRDLSAVVPAYQHDSDTGRTRVAGACAIGERKDRSRSPPCHEAERALVV